MSKVIQINSITHAEAKEKHKEIYLNLQWGNLRLRDYQASYEFLQNHLTEVEKAEKEVIQVAFESLGKVIRNETKRLRKLDERLQKIPYYAPRLNTGVKN